MKKVLIILATLIMSLALITGCSNNAAESEDGGEAMKPSEMLVSSTWKYDDSEAYIHISLNHTYQMCGADMEPGTKVTFWNYLEDSDDTIVLYNEFGGEEMTLTASGDEDNLVVTDDNGDTLSSSSMVMNGIYKCGVEKAFLEDNMLRLQAEIPQWVSDYDVQNLEVGSVIAPTDNEGLNTTVESIEKQSDTAYLINGTNELVYDEDAGAWSFSNEVILTEYVGDCQILDRTQFTPSADMEFKSLSECLDNVDGIQAGVKVDGGLAEEVYVIDVQ